MLLKKVWAALLAVIGVAENLPYPAAVERSMHDPGGKKRVVIYRLSDGTFAYQEEVFNDKLLDMRWEPKGLSQACSSPQAAEAEARKALPWLWAVHPED